MNHCLRRWICICSKCPIVCRWCTIILIGFCRCSTRKLVTLHFSNHLQNMTFPHDMLLECTKASFTVYSFYVMKSLSDLQQTVQMAFPGCFISLMQSFSEMTSGSLDAHVIFAWDFLTSIVSVFFNHSHLHLFPRPASKSSTHPSPDHWGTSCKTDILFCNVVQY